MLKFKTFKFSTHWVANDYIFVITEQRNPLLVLNQKKPSELDKQVLSLSASMC